MSTRCQIVVASAKGKINAAASIYRHHDGYPDGPHGVPAALIPAFLASPAGLSAVELLRNLADAMNATVGAGAHEVEMAEADGAYFWHSDIDFLYVVSPAGITTYKRGWGGVFTVPYADGIPSCMKETEVWTAPLPPAPPTVEPPVVRFEVGRTYSTRSACDHNCIYSYTVVARTAKRLTLRQPGESKTRVRGIAIDRGVEYCLPEGRYSMAPVIRADRVIAAEPPTEASGSERGATPWGKSWGDWLTAEGVRVTMRRKGQKVRFFDAAGAQVGPEQSNVAPAIAAAYAAGWVSVNDSPAAALPYVAKCDECKVTLRPVATMRESAAGGTCSDCAERIAAEVARVDADAKIAAERGEDAAPKGGPWMPEEIEAYREALALAVPSVEPPTAGEVAAYAPTFEEWMAEPWERNTAAYLAFQASRGDEATAAARVALEASQAECKAHRAAFRELPCAWPHIVAPLSPPDAFDPSFAPELPQIVPGDAVDVLGEGEEWVPGYHVTEVDESGEFFTVEWSVGDSGFALRGLTRGDVRPSSSNPCGDGPGCPCGASNDSTHADVPVNPTSGLESANAEVSGPVSADAFAAESLAELSALYGNPTDDDSRAALAELVGHLTAAHFPGEGKPAAPADAPGLAPADAPASALTEGKDPGIFGSTFRGSGARRARLERKVAKREEWAAGRMAKAEALEEQNTPYRGDIAFFTQPGRIVARDRFHDRVDRIGSHLQVAKHHEERAEGLARQLETSIFSDDEDATQALRDRIAEREAERRRVVEYNASARKAAKASGSPATVGNLSLLDDRQKGQLRLMVETARGNGGAVFPTYHLAGLSASIARDKERIATIERREARRQKAMAAGGVTVETSPSGWAQITFAEKPERETREALYAAGFRYSAPSWHGKASALVGELASLTGDNNP